MTASEKLVELLENDKLTDDQLDNLNSWGILTVSELREYLIDLISELKNETDSFGYENAVNALYALLEYSNDDYVVYDEDGVQELDFDVLNDALGID